MSKRKEPVSYRTANLTPDDFAAAASLNRGTVQNLIARGDLRAVKLGRAVRIPISELTRLGLDVPAYLTTRGEAA
ncbi:MAG: helix-turn-helix domain-containing protein [Actinomyces succiniciruminis]|nr:helix-turn-helix domain-containing protein [Actinomyces succiniciruminis]